MDGAPRFTFPPVPANGLLEWLFSPWEAGERVGQSDVNGSPPPADAADKGASPAALGLGDGALSWPNAEVLSKLRAAFDGYETWGRDLLVRNPFESLLALVLGGAAVYYLAERQRNDKVATYWDALEYVSTSASVGYSNIFPATPVGKMVATAAFLLGPTLTARALDPPAAGAAPAAPQSSADSQALLAKLEEILLELKNLNSTR